MVLHVFAFVHGLFSGRILDDQLHFFGVVVGLFGNDVLGLGFVFSRYNRFNGVLVVVGFVVFGMDEDILFSV